MRQILWPANTQQQQAVIEDLTRRLQYVESLLAANSAIATVAAAKLKIDLPDTLGKLEPPVLREGVDLADNTGAANQFLHALLGKSLD